MATDWSLIGTRRPPREVGVVRLASDLVRHHAGTARAGEAVTYAPPDPPPHPPVTDSPPADPHGWTKVLVAGIVFGLVPGAAVGWLLGSTLVGAAAGGVAVGTTIVTATALAGADAG